MRTVIMETCCLHDKSQIEAFLRKNVNLHIYSIGDLDDFFWHKTVWYGLKTNDEIQAVAMLYTETVGGAARAGVRQLYFQNIAVTRDLNV